MLVSIYNNHILVCTEYDATHNLLQIFRGFTMSPTHYNTPIDFMATGFMKREKPDYWHIDKPFSITTDEAPPFTVNNSFIGSNHGIFAGIRINSLRHGISASEVGTVWLDEKGIPFTLLRVENDAQLLFISDNIGNSKTEYKFVSAIQGTLTQKGSARTLSFCSQSVVDTKPTIRPIKKEVYAWINGTKQRIYDTIECDFAELYEEYEVINPATIAPALRKHRPEKGYPKNPDFTQFCEAMITFSATYRFLSDGTVLCHFNHRTLQGVSIGRHMGAMFQERIDAFGGGVRRYIPKTKHIDTPEGVFDFSRPYPLDSEIFPKDKFVTEEYYTNPNSPPDRIVDYFFDEKGIAKLGFACGYLPLYDGAPEYRSKHLSEATELIYTRKAYPTFLTGTFSRVQGISYKKYFPVSSNAASWYSVQAEGKTYLYADFFEQTTLQIPIQGKATLLEKSDSTTYKIHKNSLTLSSPKGYAVFIIK